MSMPGVLAGIRVVEMASWTYVPSAGAALADWGADVIKVESVEFGDPSRALVVGGFTRDAARADVDFMMELGNRGKRSLALDLKSELGRELFGTLLGTADVLLTNWLPGALARARLTVDDIRAFNPHIIIARGSGLVFAGRTAIKAVSTGRPTWPAAVSLTRSHPSAPNTPPVRGRPSVTCRPGRPWPAVCARRCFTGSAPGRAR